jgi:hypothetical protein
VAAAIPLASVTALMVMDPPPPVTAKFTVSPGTPLPNWSSTFASTGSVRGALTRPT